METDLLDLPLPLLGSVLAKLQSVADVASAACSCKVLRSACQEAPLALRVEPHESGGDITLSQRVSRVLPLTSALKGICETHPNVVALDLRGCAVSDVDLHLLQRIWSLRSLNLSGCQKLTVAAVQALNSGHFGQGLELLNIQRCFRIWTADYSLPLLELLTGAGSPAHCLRTLLLSHISSLDGLKVVLEHDNESTLGPSLLDEDAYPQSGVPPAAVLRSPVQRVGLVGQRLRILALHNCGKIQVEHLLALAAASSKLEVLCLGGSNVNGQRVDEVADAFSRFQQLRLLEVTFWGGQGAWSSGKADGSVSCGATLLATLRASLSYNQQQRRVRVWDLCNAVDLEEAHAWFHSQASAHERSALSAAANCSDARRRTPLHVAASRGDTVSVVRLLALGASAGGDRSVTGDGPRDVGGATALFLAAESGHVGCVDALIRGGANVLAANRGNESPLYIASLKGHCDVVAVMLQHCHERSLEWQDAKVYGDGWTPLMAAAVANRQDVANLLLQTAFKQSASELPNLLPPGLPSFVSSTVLARQTRHSGGHSGHSRVSSGLDKEQISSSSAPARNLGSIPLIDARNRYGSTALHISATKSLTWFVLNLLTAGADWHVQDSYGLTPQQVAAKLGHRDVEQILSRWDAESRGLSKPPASGSRARERRKGRASRRLPALTDVESTPRMSEWTGSLIPTN